MALRWVGLLVAVVACGCRPTAAEMRDATSGPDVALVHMQTRSARTTDPAPLAAETSRVDAAGQSSREDAAGESSRGDAAGETSRVDAAEQSGATATSVAARGDDAGCVATIDALPSARHITTSDRRLARRGLLVAHKSARRLMLFDEGELSACWKIGLGFAPTGHKAVEGDGKTPVGWYATSDKPWSTFDDAIAIHYPNAIDADDAAHDGRISRRTRDAIRDANARRVVPPQHTAMGGAVLIHGGGSTRDWTLGCIALDDADLADLRGRLPRGMRTDLLVIE